MERLLDDPDDAVLTDVSERIAVLVEGRGSEQTDLWRCYVSGGVNQVFVSLADGEGHELWFQAGSPDAILQALAVWLSNRAHTETQPIPRATLELYRAQMS